MHGQALWFAQNGQELKLNSASYTKKLWAMCVSAQGSIRQAFDFVRFPPYGRKPAFERYISGGL